MTVVTVCIDFGAQENKICHCNCFMVTVSTFGTSLVTQMVKNLPAMQETRIQSLGQEDPLQKEMATHF